MELRDIRDLRTPTGESILLVVLDGLGGLPTAPGGRTELESARTPNLDELADSGDVGLHVPVARGVTPGSGPGHLALFGYDPLRFRIGRGVLEALGVDFDLQPGDVAIRANLCTLDEEGRIEDRRAGRIATEDAQVVCGALDEIEVAGARIFVQCVKEHRAVVVIRPDDPSGASVPDTDPGRTGVPALPIAASDSESEPVARLARAWLEAVPAALAGRKTANGVLLRGFSQLPDWPRFPDVFGLSALAIAAYPMYRGVAKLVGMDAAAVAEGPDRLVEALREHGADRDFAFLHVKATDRAGEDGDFDAKVAAIEEVDSVIPDLVSSFPGVCLVTGDHSTPATMSSHSWHPVPFLIAGGPGRGSRQKNGFGEGACLDGSLGLVRGHELMPLAMARAGRLSKYGA